MMGPEYMDKTNRDKAWRDAGKPGRRTSMRNQLLHPRHVADFDKATQTRNGFGNAVYGRFCKIHFAVLYSWQ